MYERYCLYEINDPAVVLRGIPPSIHHVHEPKAGNLRMPVIDLNYVGIILCMRPANEGRLFNVKSSLIGWANAQTGPCCGVLLDVSIVENIWISA